MQYVFLIRSSAGGKKYVTRRSRVTYFLPPARERIKNTYCMGQRPFLYFYCTLISLNTHYRIVSYLTHGRTDRQTPSSPCDGSPRLCIGRQCFLDARKRLRKIQHFSSGTIISGRSSFWQTINFAYFYFRYRPNRLQSVHCLRKQRNLFRMTTNNYKIQHSSS